MASVIGKILAVVGLVMIVLGVVAIIMGFSAQWPDAHPAGAIFFTSGWLLIGLTYISGQLAGILAALQAKAESGP